jgi:alpha-L-fucosidase
MATATSTRAGHSRYGPGNVVDGSRETYWATDDGVRSPELILDLPGPTRFDVVRLREYLPLGQRVERFALDAWTGSGWHELASGTSIGSQRILRIPPTATSRVRLRITQSSPCPAISELSLFATPGS